MTEGFKNTRSRGNGLGHPPLPLPCPVALREVAQQQGRRLNTSYLTDKNHIIKEGLKTPPLCFVMQNIGEVTRSDGGVENSLSSADLYWTFTPFSFPLKEHFRLKILRPMGENEKGKHRGENKKAPATKRPQMLIHNKIQMITYSKPELHQQHKPRCNPP